MSTHSEHESRHETHNPHWSDRLSEPGLTALVTLEAIAIFVMVPLMRIGPGWHIAEFLLGVGIVACAVLVVWHNRPAKFITIVAFALGASSAFLREDLPSNLTIYLDFAAKISFLIVVTLVVGRAVFGPGPVTLHRIRGAVAIYLQVAVIFALMYLLAAKLDPTAFSPVITLTGPTGDVLRGAGGGASLIYFSLVTLTSTGYGDIIPVHPIVRSLANLEAVLGQLFPATILARLVTLEIEGRRRIAGR